MKNRKYSTRSSPGVISKEYRTWKAMKARCYAPCNANDGNYQKDNIQVCDRWLNSFDNFMDDMGYAPSPNHSLERKDNSKDYEPNNCIWIPVKEQPRNRSSVRYYTYEGKTMILKDWARELGIKYTTLYLRLFRNCLSFEEAINVPSMLIEIDGESKSVKAWCDQYGLVYQRIVDLQYRKKIGYKEILLSKIKAN